MNAWTYLLAGIVFEVIGTTFLKLSDGFSESLYSTLCIVFFVAALFMLSQSVKSIEIGVVYAIWSGVGIALITLILALFAGGRWVAAHVLVDVVMVGYVILLVRHRQLMADRMMKVEPIRPPVNEQPPASMQLAPSYLLRSKTGS